MSAVASAKAERHRVPIAIGTQRTTEEGVSRKDVNEAVEAVKAIEAIEVIKLKGCKALSP